MNNSSSAFQDDGNPLYMGTTIGYIFTSIHIIIFFPILIGNIFVLKAYYNFPAINRNKFHLCYVNLAITDICTALIAQPLIIFGHYVDVGCTKNMYCCLYVLIVLRFFSGASGLTILFIGILRFIGALYPLQYATLITKARIITVLILIWMYPLLTTQLMVFYSRNNYSPDKTCGIQVLGDFNNTFLAANMVIICLGSVFCYIKITIALKKSAGNFKVEDDNSAPNNLNDQAWRNKTKLAMKVMGCFFACWGTAAILFATNIFAKTGYVINILLHCSAIILLSNSFMNPLLYARYNRQFQDSFKQMMKVFRWQSKFENTPKTEFAAQTPLEESSNLTISENLRDCT